MLKRNQRLTQNTDFLRVKKEGRVFKTPLLKLSYFFRKDNLPPRVGFVVNKGVGGAVKRNRVKRKLREGASSFYPQINQAVDIVIIGNERLNRVTTQEIKEDLGQAFRKINIL